MSLPSEGSKGSSSLDDASETNVSFSAKWGRVQFDVSLPRSSTVMDLKQQIQHQISVPAKKQKILGLNPKGKPPADEESLEFLPANKKHSIIIMGTVEEIVFEPTPSTDRDAEEDIELTDESEDIHKNSVFLKRLEDRVSRIDVVCMHPPRKGKKLLVLDIDYTIFDHKSAAARVLDLKRPYVDHLLATVYPHYDIVVWSQTSWKWVEAKLTELGLLLHPDFQITFVLDQTSMFPVQSKSSTGEMRNHEVKALEFIWRKFPGVYDQRNTVHVDDLRRNFAMNPRNGIRVSAFRDSFMNQHDDELLKLTNYLMLIVNEPDLSALDHSKWKKLV
eukprot:TRINITY_DN1546_c0_g1_i4.p1 TRINITY_DN1546_c0_g1~~TRINITY_DN1546_c0_g1_i4.p1  ORF type:complete len:332 (-),score=76.20 TRINITY_DN1546_c0_g1_i4:452-1447(-)